ncbi:transposase [Lactiplantibacillus plantarum]|uniref:Transposase n=1 Tax=Lactiplantibacillus plantarum TaxID=1590 RepID=A0A162HEQ5_LACPN|nr:transposase [Lactiplantibacillus plantarum]KZU92135.1 transposase [Lactiplantibacillus plantarum]
MFKTHANGYIALKDQLGRTKPIEEMTEVERLRLKKRQLKTQIKEQEV